jgi:hypothetical protein
MAQRQRWNPIPSIVYGLTFGALAGSLVIWGTNDRWQDNAGILLEITVLTTVACVAVSYVRQFISN